MNSREVIREALLEHALADFNNYDLAEYDEDYSIGITCWRPSTQICRQRSP